MSAKLSPMIAFIPHLISAWGACSLLEPHPKLLLTTSIEAFLFLEIDLKNSLAKSKDLNFNLEIKESSRKMFLSGEWDGTLTLLENENLIENKFNQLPYIRFNTHLTI